MTAKFDAQKDYPTEFEQGRRARLSAISKDDAPHDVGSNALKAWTAGYDSAEGEAARNETMTPEPSSGESQVETVAKANKAK